jgi:hypothetical protein
MACPRAASYVTHPNTPHSLPHAGLNVSVVCLVEPGLFRLMHAFIQSSGQGAGRLEVVSLAATRDESSQPSEVHMGLEALSLGPSTSAQFHPYTQSATLQKGEDAAISSAVLVSSGYVAAAPAAAAHAPTARRSMAARAAAHATSEEQVVYRGSVAGLPDEHASRRERFAELDTLQPGWTVELRIRGEGGTVDAVFFSPSGERVGTFVVARRLALQASKAKAG